MTVLVLSAPDDNTAMRVCRTLAERGQDHARVDLGAFPRTLSLTISTEAGSGWAGLIGDGGRGLALADITAVYYRRPSAFELPDHLSESERRFVAAEARQGWGGLLACLAGPFVNRPDRIADAELKPAQLHVARQVGFQVPPTLITSVVEHAREFLARHRRVLYKPLSAPFLRDAEGSVGLVYASPVTASDLCAEEIALAPCQFQAFIPKRHDVRLTAVGDQCFAVAIHAGSEAAHVDWRTDYPSLTYQPIHTPAPIAEAVTRYLRRFGLAFGCFDFTIDLDGSWWFLECGPNAQWGWIEHETGLPIAAAIATLLTER